MAKKRMKVRIDPKRPKRKRRPGKAKSIKELQLIGVETGNR